MLDFVNRWKKGQPKATTPREVTHVLDFLNINEVKKLRMKKIVWFVSLVGSIQTRQHMIPQRDWEDQFVVPEDEDDDDEDEFEDRPEVKKRKVVLPRTTRSNEL